MMGFGTVNEQTSWVGQCLFALLPNHAKNHPPSQDFPGDADGFLEEQRALNESGKLFASVHRYIFLAGLK